MSEAVPTNSVSDDVRVRRRSVQIGRAPEDPPESSSSYELGNASYCGK